MPDVMMGVMPSSMSVPRFEARMTRIQYSGSAYASTKGHQSIPLVLQSEGMTIAGSEGVHAPDESDETMP